MKDEVYISYCWNSKGKQTSSPLPIVSKLEQALKKEFRIRIDWKNVQYKTSIRQFEERLSGSSRIILIINNQFLRSKHCMIELLLIRNKGDIYRRIFPIVSSDAKIFDNNGLLNYVNYWEKQHNRAIEQLNKINPELNADSLTQDIRLFEQFQQLILDIAHLLRDLHMLRVEDNEDHLIDQLRKALSGDEQLPDPGKKYVLSKFNDLGNIYDSAIMLIESELKNKPGNESEIIGKLNKWRNKCRHHSFQIGVIAMTKSGKSTFLNALLGDEFLPVSNVPETWVPVNILHASQRTGKMNTGDELPLVGAKKICEFLTKINREHREAEISVQQPYILEAGLEALPGQAHNSIRFEILDMPGFGEHLSGKKETNAVQVTNENFIDNLSAIIYLLDYTKLRTVDENKVLERLREARPDMMNKISDRIFFVVNKIDSEDRNSLSPAETKEYVYTLLSASIPNLNKDHILLLSAGNALLARLILRNKATENARRDFGEKAFGIMAETMTEEQFTHAAKKILESSMITEVEDNIIRFVYENRGSLLIESLAEKLKMLIHDFTNKYLTTAEGTLQKTIKDIEALEKKIKDTSERQQQISDEATGFEHEIAGWINEQFAQFENGTRKKLSLLFQNISNPRIGENSGWLAGMMNRIQVIFGRAQNLSRESLEERINNFNEDLMRELENEFIVFRSQLESKIFSKQQELIRRLEIGINGMVREFETVVGKNLSVQLYPVHLSLQLNQSFDEIREEAYTSLERFVGSKRVVQYEERVKTRYVDRTWCPGKKKISIPYSVRVMKEKVEVKLDEISEFWFESIQAMNNNAKTIAKKLIDEQISKQVKLTRQKFNSYVDEYLFTIRNEKISLQNGSPEIIGNRLLAIQECKRQLIEITGLAEKLVE